MYVVSKFIDVDFAHRIAQHKGACFNLHGHTWRFEVALEATGLNTKGFVCDFSEIKTRILLPVHNLLDHSLALSEDEYNEVQAELEMMGESFQELSGQKRELFELHKVHSAWNVNAKGLKITVFPFYPTSERLARWFYEAAKERIKSIKVRVAWTKVYESLHPVKSYCQYEPSFT